MILTNNLSQEEVAIICESINRCKRAEIEEATPETLGCFKISFVSQVLNHVATNLIKEEHKQTVMDIKSKLMGTDNNK